MDPLDDVCHMESRFGLFRNSVSFGAGYVHGLRLMHHSLRPFWKHPIELLDDVCHVESHFGLFGDSVSFGAR